MDKEQLLKFERQIHAWIAKLKILMTAVKNDASAQRKCSSETHERDCKKWSVDREGNWSSNERVKTLKKLNKVQTTKSKHWREMSEAARWMIWDDLGKSRLKIWKRHSEMLADDEFAGEEKTENCTDRPSEVWYTWNDEKQRKTKRNHFTPGNMTEPWWKLAILNIRWWRA